MFVAADRGRWLWFAICGLRGDRPARRRRADARFFRRWSCRRCARPAAPGGGLLDGRRVADACDRRRAILAAGASARCFSTMSRSSRALAVGEPSHFYVYPFATGPFALAVAPFDASARVCARDLHVRAAHLRARSARAAGSFCRCARGGRCWPFPARRSSCSPTPVTSGGWAITTPRSGFRGCWSRTVMGAVSGVARKANGAPRNWTTRRRRRLRVLSDRVRSDASAALSASVLSRSRRRAARDRCVPEGCVPVDVRRMVLGGGGAASARDDRSHGGAQYLVYADDFPSPAYQRLLRPAVARGRRAGRYRIVCRYGDVAAYKAEPRNAARFQGRAAGRRCAVCSGAVPRAFPRSCDDDGRATATSSPSRCRGDPTCSSTTRRSSKRSW